MLRNILNRGGVAGLRRVPLYSSHTHHHQIHSSAPILEHEKGYKYINPEEPGMSFTEITDRAATSLFFTELFRGYFSFEKMRIGIWKLTFGIYNFYTRCGCHVSPHF